MTTSRQGALRGSTPWGSPPDASRAAEAPAEVGAPTGASVEASAILYEVGLHELLRPYADAVPAKAYAGVGSRKTPRDVLETMRAIGAALARKGYTLYSGGARGADTAFRRGADAAGGDYRILLPAERFNGAAADGERFLFEPNSEAWGRAATIAETLWTVHARFHGIAPWKEISLPSRRFHTRNVLQVLGPGCERKVSYLICWTADGMTAWHERTPESGGTSQAIALASLVGVDVINLRRASDRQRVIEGLARLV
jgi:hypothetical protein